MSQPAKTAQPTARDTIPLARRTKIASIIVAAILVIGGATYLAGQYESATQPTSLSAIPQYPYSGSAFPFGTLSPRQRGEAEATLRAFANSIEPGYRASAERFMACAGEFVWDAVRSNVNGYLSASSFHIQSVGQLPDTPGDLAFIIWARTNRLQNIISKKHILAVGMQQPIQAGQIDRPVHVYAYFELVPTS